MFFGNELDLLVVCLIVIFGRIVDMSLATIRTVFTVKNSSLVAALIGLFEAFFWFLVVKAALDYQYVDPVKDTLFLAFAYSTGFALGTFLGSKLSKFFVKGKLKLQIVLSKKNDEIVEKIREKGFGQTVVICFGANKKEETYMIFAEINSRQLKEFKDLIDNEDPHAFISVDESKSVFNGYFSNRK